VPDEIASQVLEIAEGIEQRENDMRRELAQGMDFVTASATFLRD